MPAPGMMAATTVEVLRLHAAGLGCVEIGKRVGVTPKTVCAAVKRWKRRKVRGQYDDDKGANMTAAEVDALEAQQRQCLPKWWRAETVRESRQTQSLGRAAEEICLRARWVKRKARKI